MSVISAEAVPPAAAPPGSCPDRGTGAGGCCAAPVLTRGEGPLRARGQPGVLARGMAAAQLFRRHLCELGEEANATAKHPGPQGVHQQGARGHAPCRGTHRQPEAPQPPQKGLKRQGIGYRLRLIKRRLLPVNYPALPGKGLAAGSQPVLSPARLAGRTGTDRQTSTGTDQRTSDALGRELEDGFPGRADEETGDLI